jgi:hypothetical protein
VSFQGNTFAFSRPPLALRALFVLMPLPTVPVALAGSGSGHCGLNSVVLRFAPDSRKKRIQNDLKRHLESPSLLGQLIKAHSSRRPCKLRLSGFAGFIQLSSGALDSLRIHVVKMCPRARACEGDRI